MDIITNKEMIRYKTQNMWNLAIKTSLAEEHETKGNHNTLYIL